MANIRFSYANERFLSGQLNWLAQTFRVVMVDTTIYQVQATVHRHLADVPLTARIHVSPPLTGMTATGGRAMADNVTTSVVIGPTVQAVIIFHDTGDASTSELIVYLDTLYGLPYHPQGEPVVIHWDTGPNGIFLL
jgi:hypothetical protein